MPTPNLPTRSLTCNGAMVRQLSTMGVGSMDFVYLALGAGVLIALGFYTHALNRL